MMPAWPNSASWVTSGVARGRGVRGGGALPGRGPAADDGQHGHPPADPARGARELARAAEGLDVQHGQPGQLVLLPPHQQVVAGHVVLVADRGERGHADAEPGQLLEQRDPDAAGLHDDARAPGPRRLGRRRSRSARCRARAMPRQFGPTSRMPYRRQIASRSAPAAPRPEVITVRAPDARGCPQSAATAGTAGGGHRDDRQVHVARAGRRPRPAHGTPSMGRRVRVDRVDRPGEAAGHDVVQDGPAHGDRRRRLAPMTATDAGAAGAAGWPRRRGSPGWPPSPGSRPGAGRRRRRAAGRSARTAPSASCRRTGSPASANTRSIAALSASVVARERGQAAQPGQRDQVLQQQGGDAAPVQVVGDGEGDLGACPAAPAGS